MNGVEFFSKIKASPVELFGMVFAKGKDVIGYAILGEGDAKGVRFSKRTVIEAVEAAGADSVMLVHNHPEGELRPSNADLETTYTLIDHFKPQGIPVTDHLIIGKGGYYSFKANGVI